MALIDKVYVLMKSRNKSDRHIDLSGSRLTEKIETWNEAVLGPFPTIADGFTAEELGSREDIGFVPVHPESLALADREAAFANDADRIILVERLRNATPAQIRTYMNNNVTDLPSARLMLTRLALVLATAIRR